jgi:5-methylcytosine-specific restriction endonuclease McrA
MEKALALKLNEIFINALEENKRVNEYEIERIDKDGKPLVGFHPWADYKDIIGAFLVSDSFAAYYFLFIDWRQNDNFYIVIYQKNKSKPILEIHKTDLFLGRLHLNWSYNPTKRDGKNEERKACFKKYCYDDMVHITVPSNLNEMNYFLDEIFTLANNRIKADQLIENEMVFREGFAEGYMYEILHKVKERNKKLVAAAKLEARKKYGRLKCQICDFDFYELYGEIGADFIEVHHTNPICETEGETITKIDELALVCSNCHSMIHRKRPWLNLSELKSIMNN